MIAWHITREMLSDGRPLPAIGETLRYDGPVDPCKQGLHASARLIDALQCAPDGACWLHRVDLGGTVEHGGDQLIASERTIIASYSLRLNDLLALTGECAALACWLSGLTGDVYQRAAAATTAYRLGECGPDVLRAAWTTASRDTRGAAKAAALAAVLNARAAADGCYAGSVAWATAARTAATAANAAVDAVDIVDDWGDAAAACEARAVAMLTGGTS